MLYSPHAKQAVVHTSLARNKVLNWGRRTGKSTLAVQYTLWEALQKYGEMCDSGEEITSTHRYFIVAPTYRQAKSIYWNEIIKTRIPSELAPKYNEQELTVTFPHFEVNGKEANLTKEAKQMPAIVIELKGAENEDSLRGVKLHGAVMDEFAFMSPTVWQYILRPALADERGWALFISTPNGFNHWYDLCEKARSNEKWLYSHATAYDNPHMDPEEIEEIRSDTTEDQFAQEYLADFRKVSGIVFPEFSIEHHVVPANTLPTRGTHLLGIDFGYTSPLAGVYVLVDYDQNWWVYDCVYQTLLHTEQAVSILRDKMGVNQFARVIGDSAAATEIENFRQRNFPITPSVKGKDSIKAGIRLIAEKLKIQEGSGRPKLFILDTPSNKPLIQEFQSYARPVDAEGNILSELPLDENNHALDALRYLMLTNQLTVRATPKRQKHYDSVTGRLVS